MNTAPSPKTPLRTLAEAIAAVRTGTLHVDLESLNLSDRTKLMHELRVHQIELELQNDTMRKMQIQLENEMQRYRGLYDQAPVGYLSLEGDGLIARANLYAAGLLGVSPQELLGRSLSDYIFRDDQDAYYLFRRNYLQSQKRLSVELRLRKSDGTVFWAKLDGSMGDEATVGIIMDDCI